MMLSIQHLWKWIRLLHMLLAVTSLPAATRPAFATSVNAVGGSADVSGIPSPRNPRQPLDNQSGDAFGYGFMDNVAPDTASYSWIELRGDPQATVVTAWSNNNDGCASSPCAIGFSFPFYGQNYTSFTPTTNGQIEFGSCSSLPDTACMPNAAWSPSILPYMYDMRLRFGGYDTVNTTVAYRNFGASTVIEFFRLGYSQPDSDFSFVTCEAILFNNGRIKLQYHDVVLLEPAPMGTVGIQNGDASIFLQYRCCNDGNTIRPITSGLAIWFIPGVSIPMPVANPEAEINETTVLLTWTDPSEDTNGNPLTPDSVLIYRNGTASNQQIGHVAGGVQAYTASLQPEGILSYFFRVKAGSWASSFISVPALVGTPSYASFLDTTSGGWTSSGTWTWGVPTNPMAPQPHSGSGMWGTGMDNNYDFNLCTWIDLNLGLRVTRPGATFQFWGWWEEWPAGCLDGCNFKVSVDGGGTWAVVTPQDGYGCENYVPGSCISGEDAWAWSSHEWRCLILPLGQFMNQVPIFRLTFASYHPYFLHPGFFVDDVSVWGLEPHQAVVGTVRSDGGDDSPLNNVRVWATGGTDTSQSNSAGWYRLTLEPGTYSVNYRHDTHCDTMLTGIVVVPEEDDTFDVSLRYPTAMSSVSSLQFVVDRQMTEQRTIALSATGPCPLHYQITDSVAWLIIDPPTGYLNSGEHDSITVTATPGNMPAGEYQTMIQIVGSFPDTVRVFVEMIVRDLGADNQAGILPTEFSLHTVYPNPFNATTLIRFDLPRASYVTMNVYDLTGRLVETLASRMYDAGTHNVAFKGEDRASGMYVVRMNSSGFSQAQKVLLLK